MVPQTSAVGLSGGAAVGVQERKERRAERTQSTGDSRAECPWLRELKAVNGLWVHLTDTGRVHPDQVHSQFNITAESNKVHEHVL